MLQLVSPSEALNQAFVLPKVDTGGQQSKSPHHRRPRKPHPNQWHPLRRCKPVKRCGYRPKPSTRCSAWVMISMMTNRPAPASKTTISTRCGIAMLPAMPKAKWQTPKKGRLTTSDWDDMNDDGLDDAESLTAVADLHADLDNDDVEDDFDDWDDDDEQIATSTATSRQDRRVA